MDYDYKFKILIIGDPVVGKTTILEKYARNQYKSEYLPTIGVDVFYKTIKFKNKLIKLMIWDIAGQERFRNLVTSYYRDVDHIILMYDLTNRQSFINLNFWIKDIEQYAGFEKEITLVGNKNDLIYRKVVSNNEGLNYANLIDANNFLEISIDDDNKINMLFNTIISNILDKKNMCENKKNVNTKIHSLWNKISSFWNKNKYTDVPTDENNNNKNNRICWCFM
jgi:Ras-related protein Rab-1A